MARSTRWVAALWACCVVAWIGVGVLLLLPGGAAPVDVGASDKLAHAAAWGILAASLWLALAHGTSWTLPRRAAVVLGAAALYAVATEALQGLSPGRSPEVLDVAADMAGAAIAVAVLAAWEAIRGR